jgi:hypothetical protein
LLAGTCARGKEFEIKLRIALVWEVPASKLAEEVPASKLAGRKAAASCTHSKASLCMPAGERYSATFFGLRPFKPVVRNAG